MKRSRTNDGGQRYTLAHLAHDVKNQTGFGEPTRDWFPISSEHLQRLGRCNARWGSKQRLGPTVLRLPSELRDGDGDDDR